MKHLQKITAFLLLIALTLAVFTSCELTSTIGEIRLPDYVDITNGDEVEVQLNDTLALGAVDFEGNAVQPTWSASNDCATVSINGTVTALKLGEVIVTATYKDATDSILVKVIARNTAPPVGDTPPADDTPPTDTDTTPPDTTPPADDTDTDPYENVSKTDFYARYTPAKSYTDAAYRTKHGLMSGSLTVPDEAPTIAADRPAAGGKFILNTDMIYLDGGKTYVVVDEDGNEAMRIYYGGAYVTLEEVAAYLYAFGDVPPNYSSKKTPTNAMWTMWGEYLRANHSNFSGNTSKYPYEPELPNISGCGGRLQYKELDIGTTGTTAGDGYPVRIYNDGKKITRGAARIVYGRCDLNGNGSYDEGEIYLFYTYNHYNDFQEYLNYLGGWGETFGNITGGGALSSKYDYNPTPYVPVARKAFSSAALSVACEYVIVTYLGYYNKSKI